MIIYHIFYAISYLASFILVSIVFGMLFNPPEITDINEKILHTNRIIAVSIVALIFAVYGGTITIVRHFIKNNSNK